jgi:hypothetical protein
MPLTLDGTTGIVEPTNAAPAFSVYQSTSQTGITGGVWTKMGLQTELFDTNSNFDSATNSRFTPTIAGYYWFVGSVGTLTSAINNDVALYKNGSAANYGVAYPTAGGGASPRTQVSALIYLNGSTDYVELYGYASGTWSSSNSNGVTYLQGFLARSA